MKFNENPNFDEKKYFEELNKKFKEEKERENKTIMEMKTTDNYINWLEKFTLKYPIFDDYIINTADFPDLEPKDIENINNLGIFFGMIDAYAKENYIYPLDENENYYVKYFIKHNNVYYLIGYDNIYCTAYRVERVPNEKINEINNYLEYRDIQTNKQREDTNTIKIKLATLVNIIYEYSREIPIEALQETIDNTIFDIKNNLESKNSKILKKIKKPYKK